jgi:hypothetical protein
MERLARTDPVAFFENCVRRYQLHVNARPEVAAGLAGFAGQPGGLQPWGACAALAAGSSQVQGYSLTMSKQEYIDGKLHPKELVEVHFRDRPHSVYMRWLEGARKAERVLYVEGENNGKAVVRPKGLLARKVVGDRYPIEVDSPQARASARYNLKEYGMRNAAMRTLAFCRSDLANGIVRVEYQGMQKIKEAGDRPCFVLRFNYNKPQRDGCTDALIQIDQDSWMQVGFILRRADGSLVAAYHFRDIHINPAFKANQFQLEALTP